MYLLLITDVNLDETMGGATYTFPLLYGCLSKSGVLEPIGLEEVYTYVVDGSVNGHCNLTELFN